MPDIVLLQAAEGAARIAIRVAVLRSARRLNCAGHTAENARPAGGRTSRSGRRRASHRLPTAGAVAIGNAFTRRRRRPVRAGLDDDCRTIAHRRRGVSRAAGPDHPATGTGRRLAAGYAGAIAARHGATGGGAIPSHAFEPQSVPASPVLQDPTTQPQVPADVSPQVTLGPLPLGHAGTGGGGMLSHAFEPQSVPVALVVTLPLELAPVDLLVLVLVLPRAPTRR